MCGHLEGIKKERKLGLNTKNHNSRFIENTVVVDVKALIVTGHLKKSSYNISQVKKTRE